MRIDVVSINVVLVSAGTPTSYHLPAVPVCELVIFQFHFIPDITHWPHIKWGVAVQHDFVPVKLIPGFSRPGAQTVVGRRSVLWHGQRLQPGLQDQTKNWLKLAQGMWSNTIILTVYRCGSRARFPSGV